MCFKNRVRLGGASGEGERGSRCGNFFGSSETRRQRKSCGKGMGKGSDLESFIGHCW